MAKLPIGDKAQKTGKLLFGLNNPRVAAQLEPYGYSEVVHREGWGFLTLVSRNRLATHQALPEDPKDLDDLEDFASHWFPIARAMLERTYSALANELFGNLRRTEGQSVTIGVGVFVERLDAMERGDEPFGADGPLAREHLRSRGLSDQVVSVVKEKLVDVQDLHIERAPEPELDQEQIIEAEEAMWKWYLEWSAIVRTVIKDGNLLRSLGFRKRKGRFSVSNDEVEIAQVSAPGEVLQLSAKEELPLSAE